MTWYEFPHFAFPLFARENYELISDKVVPTISTRKITIVIIIKRTASWRQRGRAYRSRACQTCYWREKGVWGVLREWRARLFTFSYMTWAVKVNSSLHSSKPLRVSRHAEWRDNFFIVTDPMNPTTVRKRTVYIPTAPSLSLIFRWNGSRLIRPHAPRAVLELKVRELLASISRSPARFRLSYLVVDQLGESVGASACLKWLLISLINYANQSLINQLTRPSIGLLSKASSCNYLIYF